VKARGRIKVTITPAGDVKVAVEGKCGPGCKDMTRELENDLGDVSNDTKTPEFFQQETKQGLKQGGA
jgi:hypothetical protein